MHIEFISRYCMKIYYKILLLFHFKLSFVTNSEHMRFKALQNAFHIETILKTLRKEKRYSVAVKYSSSSDSFYLGFEEGKTFL